MWLRFGVFESIKWPKEEDTLMGMRGNVNPQELLVCRERACVRKEGEIPGSCCIRVTFARMGKETYGNPGMLSVPSTPSTNTNQ